MKDVDFSDPNSLFKAGFKYIGAEKIIMNELPSAGFREALFFASDSLSKAVANQLTHEKSGLLKNNDNSTVRNQLRMGLDSIIVLYKGGKGLWETLEKDINTRKAINEEMHDYIDAGFQGVGHYTSVNQENKVLQRLEQSLNATTNVGAWKSAFDFLISGGQYYSRVLDLQMRQETAAYYQAKDDVAVERKVDTKNEKTEDYYTDLLETKTQDHLDILKTKMNDYRNIASIMGNASFITEDVKLKNTSPPDNHSTSKNSKTKQGSNSKNSVNLGPVYENAVMSINKATSFFVGGALLGHFCKEGAEKDRAAIADKVIAYDLIQYLSEVKQRCEICSKGMIPLDRFMADHKGHQFHTIAKNAKSVSVEDFIKEIFTHHVNEHGGQGISQRYEEEFNQISRDVAKAIEGKNNKAGISMHPMALVELVGMGELVDHRGLECAHDDIVEREITRMQELMPYEHKVNAHEYMSMIGLEANQLHHRIGNASPKQAADLAIMLLPKSIATEICGINGRDFNQRKTALQDEVITSVKLAVLDLCSQSDEELRKAMMKPKEIAVLRKALEVIEKNNDQELSHMLHDKGTKSLAFALMCNQTYWNALETGTPLGAISKERHPERHEALMHPKEVEKNVAVEQHEPVAPVAPVAHASTEKKTHEHEQAPEAEAAHEHKAEHTESAAKEEAPVATKEETAPEPTKKFTDKIASKANNITPFARTSIAPENFKKSAAEPIKTGIKPADIVAQRENLAGSSVGI